MSYSTWQEALEALVKREGLERSELGEISERASLDPNCRYWLEIYEDYERRASRLPPTGP